MSNFSVVTNSGRCFIVCVCSLAVLAAGEIDAAAQNSQKASETAAAPHKSSGPYCGLYCVYTAMKILGRENLEFRQLMKPQYIGSSEGSVLGELKKAAEDNGLYGVPAGKMTANVLRNCPYPVILHVKSQPTSRQYDHYELFLGIQNDEARLFSPPGPLRLTPFHELAPRWDGAGLVLSTEPIQLGAIFAPAKKRFGIYAGLTLAMILIVRWGRRWLPQTLLNSRRKLLALSGAQAAAIALLALLAAFIYHFANEEGFLAHANAASSVQQAHLVNFIPKINEKEAGDLLDNGDAVFVDARYASDFEAGHLEGAISIPVDANEWQFEGVTSQIGRDVKIVVYCQSAGCRFAEKVAVRLLEDGFSNVSIFKGGWNEWVAKKDK
ncbi:MAG TPA: rhodanese-like domain-containing protein [Sedimentisphaerales bacterium]|nr:rhodanese-like domain-containing protein [Sedimentisphaerales bacterium]